MRDTFVPPAQTVFTGFVRVAGGERAFVVRVLPCAPWLRVGWRKPVLQYPDPISDVNQSAGDFLGADAAERAVNRKF